MTQSLVLCCGVCLRINNITLGIPFRIFIFFSFFTLPFFLFYIFFVYMSFMWWFVHNDESTFVHLMKLAEHFLSFCILLLISQESTHIELHGVWCESKSNSVWKWVDKNARWVGIFILHNPDAFSRRTAT